jgi:malonyl-CoA O-methyltransferase
MSEHGGQPEHLTDKQAVAGAFGRAAVSYDSAARLQRLVAAELLSWWKPARGAPASDTRVLDIGCGTGQLLRLLSGDVGVGKVFGLDIAMGMLEHCRANEEISGAGLVLGDAECWPFGVEVFDLIVSNFALQWCDEPGKVFAGVARSLAPGGRCLVAMPVEGTLRELRDSWAAADPGGEHVSRFWSPGEIEAFANDAGLAVQRRSLVKQTALYGDVASLARELKTLGAHSGARHRSRHLTGRRTYAAMLAHYERFRRPDGKLPASWSVFMAEFRKEA